MAPSVGKTLYVQHFLVIGWPIFPVAGSGNTIRFGSLEYPALSPMGTRVPFVFEPSQAFLFESLDFVAYRLGVLHLREETRDPTPVGETPSIDSGTRDFNGAASALYSEQTLCSNPHYK